MNEKAKLQLTPAGLEYAMYVCINEELKNKSGSSELKNPIFDDFFKTLPHVEFYLEASGKVKRNVLFNDFNKYLYVNKINLGFIKDELFKYYNYYLGKHMTSNIQKVKIIVRDDDTIKELSVNIDFTNRYDLENYRFWEDGKYHYCNRWKRKDGNVDSYEAIFTEAQNNGLNPNLA